jgi:hypothetical protein
MRLGALSCICRCRATPHTFGASNGSYAQRPRVAKLLILRAFAEGRAYLLVREC